MNLLRSSILSLFPGFDFGFWLFSLKQGTVSELLLFVLGYRIPFLPGIQSFQLSYAMPTTSSIFRELDSILISIDSTFFYWMAREVVLDVQVVCNLLFLSNVIKCLVV